MKFDRWTVERHDGSKAEGFRVGRFCFYYFTMPQVYGITLIKWIKTLRKRMQFRLFATWTGK